MGLVVSSRCFSDSEDGKLTRPLLAVPHLTIVELGVRQALELVAEVLAV
jgi:hypothetical protein